MTRKGKNRWARIAALGLVVPLLLGFTRCALQAQVFSTVYSFGGACDVGSGAGTDGSNPFGAGVIADNSGNLYGDTSCGGTYGKGTAFELVKSSTGYTEQILYNFGSISGDGNEPESSLVMDGAGNLYGTTSYGGSNGLGTVYKLAKSSSGYTEQILHSFGYNGDAVGVNTGANLIVDSSGNLYGTTMGGGVNKYGAVFELTKTSSGYSEQILYSFSYPGTGTGYQPMGGLLMDSSGNLYGTTEYGGANANGTVYELVKSPTGYSETTLYSFKPQSQGDATFSEANLIMDASGNLYGTSVDGGANDAGAVFELVKGAAGYTEQVIYSFSAGTYISNYTVVNSDGRNPRAGLVMDGSGNLYGTAFLGGTYGSGAVFELVKSSSGYSEKTTHDFSAYSGTNNANYDGFYPQDNLYLDSSGNLFGTALNGGATGNGTVFEMMLASEPAVSFNPPSVSFGSVNLNTQSSAQIVTVANNGSANLVFGSGAVTMAGANAADFAVTSDGCSGQTIGYAPPNNTCSVSVTFTPRLTTPESASLQFADNAPGSPQTVVLGGTGVQVTVSLLPTSLKFSSQAGVTASAQTVTLTNTASTPLTLTGIGTSPGEFAVASPTAGTPCSTSTPLPANSACTIGVTFTPTAADTGTIAGTLSIAYQGAGSPQTAILLGTVVSNMIADGTAIAINANNQPGLTYNAVLNQDSSVGLIQNGTYLAGRGCPAFPRFPIQGVGSGAVYVDPANSRIYLAMTTYSAGPELLAASESFDGQGNCIQSPLVQLETGSIAKIAMNVDPAQGLMYVLAANGGGIQDSLYILPAAPWSATSPPTPTQLTLDYSAVYGPIAIDASNHQVYIDDLGSSAYGNAGTYATSGFFVYDPNHSATPANNLQHVTGYTSNGGATLLNVGTLLDNGHGILALVNENPNAATVKLSNPITILDTTKFSFFSNTQQGSSPGTVNIAPGNGLSTIPATAPYMAISAADIDSTNGLVYVFAFNSTAQPGELIQYNIAPGVAIPESVLNGAVAMPVLYNGVSPWTQLNFDPESTQIAMAAEQYGSGALGVMTPLCAGSPSLTQIIGNQGAPTPVSSLVVNAASGYLYAIQGASQSQSAGIDFVAPSSAGCSAPATYTIGGTVSGLGSGVSVTLLDNGGDAYTASANGAFNFSAALASGATYNVTVSVQPAGETCTVTNGSGTVGTANVTNIAIACSPIAIPPAQVIDDESIAVSDVPQFFMGALSGESEAILVQDTANVQVSGYAIATVTDNETITVSDAGIQPLTGVLGSSNEAVTVMDRVSVQAQQTATTTALSASALISPAGYSVTFTAVVAASGGAFPTGTVTFYDGATALATATLANGAASYTTSALPAGNDSILAVYSGGPDFLGSTSPAISENITSFALNLSALSSSGGLTLLPGQSVSFTFTVTPAYGSYSEPVFFSIAGLPAGFTASFNPNPVTPGNSPVTVTLTITAAPLLSKIESNSLFRNREPLLLALLVPLLGLRRIRQRLRRRGLHLLIAILSLAAIAGISSCTGAGFFNQSPQSYSVTLKAASGSAQQSASFNLTVE